MKWVVFRLEREMFALPIDTVQEVMMAHAATPVPLAPASVAGLINLRGQIMPAIELRDGLGFPPRASGSDSAMIVIACGELVAAIVDEVCDVLELPPTRWREPPETIDAA